MLFFFFFLMILRHQFSFKQFMFCLHSRDSESFHKRGNPPHMQFCEIVSAAIWATRKYRCVRWMWGVRGGSSAWVHQQRERSRSENYSEGPNTAGWSVFVNKVLWGMDTPICIIDGCVCISTAELSSCSKVKKTQIFTIWPFTG